MALPGASFVGVDAAPKAIARGQGLVAELGLENVTLEATAIEDLSPAAGAFDYVIAHGVYSWVPAAVRDRLLAVCREALADAGVAYVSYNALPGGRLREALRDMLVFHTAELTDPRERVAQARALLRFLLDGAPGEHGLGALMRGQAERMLARSDATLLHDELAEVNDAALLPRVRGARRPPRTAVPRRGGLLRDADRRGLRAGRAGAHGDRGPGAPRAVPRLPQGAHVPPDAAVPRRASRSTARRAPR